MKDDRVHILLQKRQFWRKLQKIVECNDMKDDRVQVLPQKQLFGREFQKFAQLDDRIQVAQ